MHLHETVIADLPQRLAETVSPSGRQLGSMNLLDILILLARRKRTLLGFSAGFALALLMLSVLLPGDFSSTTTILPPKQGSSGLASVLKAQAGGLADLGEDLGLIRENQTLFVALLESNRVLEALVGRFDLVKVYKVRTREKAVDELAKRTDIVPKQGLISILVRDTDRERAARLANGYVEELYKLNQELAITEAAQRRAFFANQLAHAKDDLLGAELALKKTQENTRLIQVDSQGKAIIDGVAKLRAQVTASEVELRGLLLSATDQNPAVIRQRERVSALRAQLAETESATERGPIEGARNDIQIPTSQIPQAEFEYVRAMREVKYREALFEMLAKQLEAAQLDEAKSAPMVEVVDRAVPSERSPWPSRVLQAVVGGLIGLFLSLVWICAVEVLDRLRQIPEQNARLEVLFDSIGLHRSPVPGEGRMRP